MFLCSIVFVMDTKSTSLFWRYGSNILYGKSSHRDRVNKLNKTGVISEWVRQYVPKAQEQKKSQEEVRADLEDRLNKLLVLLSEDILQNDFERKLVKDEIKQLKLLLD